MSAEASSVAQSQLDLYDFFSVLLPGVYFLITLIPIVPKSLPLGTATAAVVLLVTGYVVGQALHTAAESRDKSPSNRETFINAITSRDEGDSEPLLSDRARNLLQMLPNWLNIIPVLEWISRAIHEQKESNPILNDPLKDRFYEAVSVDSEVSVPPDRTQADETDLTTLYVYARSRLYQHGNVRSGSFQAIYSFYRSTYLATLVAAVIYGAYAIGDAIGYWSEVGNYTTFIGGLDLPAAAILAAAEVVLIAGLLTLHDAKDDYRKYYIEYLIVDYLTIRSADQ